MKFPLLIGTSTMAAKLATRRRILIDGREIPGIVSIDPERCMARVVMLDPAGQPIGDGNGGLLTVRRAGKIEVLP
jgi:hypothetical protein